MAQITEHQIDSIPKSLIFGHVIYSIHTDQNEIVDNENDPIDISEQVGGTFHTSRQVWVRVDGMALEQVQNTLLHEVLHVCLNVAGAQYALEQLKPSSNVEEAYVSALSTPLHGLLVQNPDLIEFLQR